MTHELRTPLNSILRFSDVLASADNLDTRQQKYVGNIQVSGRALMTLINDILDLAKMEAGKMQLHVIEFVVADLVERLAGSMLPLAEKKNISLDSEGGSGDSGGSAGRGEDPADSAQPPLQRREVHSRGGGSGSRRSATTRSSLI